jgi:hypothetical protein
VVFNGLPLNETFEVGELELNKSTFLAIKLTNRSSLPVALGRPKVSCGCMSAISVKEEIGDGESAKLFFIFTPNEAGAFEKQMKYKFGEGDVDTVQFSIRGTVKPRYDLKPSRIDIAGSVQSRIQLIANFGAFDDVKSITCVSNFISSVDVVSRSKASLIISVEAIPEQLYASGREQTVSLIVTDDDKEHLVPLSVVDSSKALPHPSTVIGVQVDEVMKFSTAVNGEESAIERFLATESFRIGSALRMKEQTVPVELKTTRLSKSSCRIDLFVSSSWLRQIRESQPFKAIVYDADGAELCRLKLILVGM